MTNTRTLGLNHIYLDTKIEDYSNIALGYIIRAIGHGLKIAYVDCADTSSKFSNFIENLSLSYSFTKNFPRLNMDLFTFKKNEIISRTLIPDVEFANLTQEMFWNQLPKHKYDLIIFDNANFEKISKFKMINTLNSKSSNTEIVVLMDKKEDYAEIKSYFDLNCELSFKENNKGLSNVKSILNITGQGRGKSFFSYGYLLRSYVNKKAVKLIYFDKEDNLYGEQFFFKALKRWARENDMYGSFDYVATGKNKFNGATYRQENDEEDIKEAKEGLMLLKTSLLKDTPVIADELNSAIENGLLSESEVLKVLENVHHELIITGNKSPSSIKKISSLILTIKSSKDYLKKNKGFRKGIDY
ncbi:MAG: cob(I)yrinic acid a,c-diamide adenosyltransferase [Nanoarchaeales archaeon]|nr:cob(I)yrinic acid a,c-diamide adenosyltransferase [Nanoarchaeales archaeon]